MTQLSQFRWMPRKDAAQTVAKYLQPSVRFSLDDVVELPDIVEREVTVAMGAKQRQAYLEIKRDAAAALASGTVTAVNGGVVYTKLLQTSCGYVYLDNGKIETLDNQARLDATMDIIDATARKVIVFCSYISAVHGVAEALKREGYDYRVVTGATPQAERTDTFNQFQNTTNVHVLVAHPQCMSHGLTLTAADTIVWFSPTSSLEIFEQANARIRRVGQSHKQQIVMLASTEAERAAYRALRGKRSIQDNVLDLLAELTTEQE
jgi:SNF2 family DNA or RNA helicase